MTSKAWFQSTDLRVPRLCRSPVRSGYAGYALPEDLRYFWRLPSPDELRHSLKSNTNSPVRHSLTALGSG
jgi:hypothetical protein